MQGYAVMRRIMKRCAKAVDAQRCEADADIGDHEVIAQKDEEADREIKCRPSREIICKPSREI